MSIFIIFDLANKVCLKRPKAGRNVLDLIAGLPSLLLPGSGEPGPGFLVCTEPVGGLFAREPFVPGPAPTRSLIFFEFRSGPLPAPSDISPPVSYSLPLPEPWGLRRLCVPNFLDCLELPSPEVSRASDDFDGSDVFFGRFDEGWLDSFPDSDATGEPRRFKVFDLESEVLFEVEGALDVCALVVPLGCPVFPCLLVFEGSLPSF